MCFYDINVSLCNCWRWGHFRQHCAKEYRTGETCGMRLVMQSYQLPENCKICTKIETKVRAIKKEEERIKRWRNEGNRTHSIEKSQEMILHLEHEIKKLENDRDERQRSLW
jgi:peptidoglycan hydrolase CwlO-like protein